MIITIKQYTIHNQSPMLYALSRIYNLIILLWREIALRKTKFSDSSLFFISAGNLSIGGSGKTPLICLLIELLNSNQKNEIALFSRGYKRLSKEAVYIPAASKDAPVELVGDEPAMIKNRYPATQLYIGKDRVASAKMLVANLKQKTIVLLDDGYQQLAIAHDINLALFDGTTQLSKLKLLPQGLLRENLSQLKRATAVVITKSNFDPENSTKLENLISSYCSCPIFKLEYYCQGIFEYGSLTDQELSPHIAQGKFCAICGIANPKSFIKSLELAKIVNYELLTFADHHNYQLKDLQMIKYPILTTEKDARKIAELADKPRLKIYYLKMSLKMTASFSEYILTNLSKRGF